MNRLAILLLSIEVGLATITAQAQTRAYVTDISSNTVSVIDTATNTVVATIPVGVIPFGVAITPDGTRAYVANVSSNYRLGHRHRDQHRGCDDTGWGIPRGVAITPDGTRAYVTNEGSNTVSVIDTATNTVVATIPVGVIPFGVAIAITPGIGPPTNKDQCKDGGWETFTIPRKFKNQGDCVSFVNTGK